MTPAVAVAPKPKWPSPDHNLQKRGVATGYDPPMWFGLASPVHSGLLRSQGSACPGQSTVGEGTGRDSRESHPDTPTDATACTPLRAESSAPPTNARRERDPRQRRSPRRI